MSTVLKGLSDFITFMRKDKPLKQDLIVSVIMSVYDGVAVEHLKEAVNSILNQTFNNFEFIIVLDGVRRKDMLDFLAFIEKKDSRIRLIKVATNKGLANAMNVAIKAAKGEFLVRMDADDISKPDRLEKLVKYMLSNPDIDVAGSFIEEFSEKSNRKNIIKYPTKHDEMKKLFLRRNPLAHASAIFRKRFFEKAGYYPLYSITNEDTLLWLNGFISGCKFGNVPEVLYSVRFNEGMGSRRIGSKKSFSDLIDRLRVIIDLNGSIVDIFFALGLFFIQNLPYSIYKFIRAKLIYEKS